MTILGSIFLENKMSFYQCKITQFIAIYLVWLYALWVYRNNKGHHKHLQRFIFAQFSNNKKYWKKRKNGVFSGLLLDSEGVSHSFFGLPDTISPKDDLYKRWALCYVGFHHYGSLKFTFFSIFRGFEPWFLEKPIYSHNFFIWCG